MSKTNKLAIAFDFDGVIHVYRNGWKDGSIYDKANKNVIKLIVDLMDAGYPVFIFSTRSPRQIKRWLENMEESGIMDFDEIACPFTPYSVQVIPWYKKFWNKERVLGVTRRKLPATHYVDDRAVKFTGDIEAIKRELPDI